MREDVVNALLGLGSCVCVFVDLFGQDGRGRIRAGQAGGGGKAAAPAACAPAAGIPGRGCVCDRANTRGAQASCAPDLEQVPLVRTGVVILIHTS